MDLPPGEDVAVAFSDYRFESPGDHALEVRLQSDQLDIDNHRYLSVPVKPAVQVLCVDGRPSGDPLRGATGYLATALAPPGETSGQAAVHVDVVPESALLEAELAHYDCVFLANVAQFTANEAKVLDTYLQGGGGLVFFLGPQVVPEHYNRELARKAEGREPILPAELGNKVEEPQHKLDPLDYAHPIVRAFRGQEKAGLLNTPVQQPTCVCWCQARPKAKVALRLANGDPLIVEQPVHRGRVILVATSADRRWTLMPIWPSYPAAGAGDPRLCHRRAAPAAEPAGRRGPGRLALLGGRRVAGRACPTGGRRSCGWPARATPACGAIADTSMSGAVHGPARHADLAERPVRRQRRPCGKRSGSAAAGRLGEGDLAGRYLRPPDALGEFQPTASPAASARATRCPGAALLALAIAVRIPVGPPLRTPHRPPAL